LRHSSGGCHASPIIGRTMKVMATGAARFHRFGIRPELAVWRPARRGRRAGYCAGQVVVPGEPGDLAAVAGRPATVSSRAIWLYGEHGGKFVAAILRAAPERESLDVVSDARGQPSWSFPLAQQQAALGRRTVAGQAPPGTNHGTASDITKWSGLARGAVELSGLDPERTRPLTSNHFRRPARGPAFSVLSHACRDRTGIAPLGGWRDMLGDALDRPAFAVLRGGPR
jgi:hypothetical protein